MIEIVVRTFHTNNPGENSFIYNIILFLLFFLSRANEQMELFKCSYFFIGTVSVTGLSQLVKCKGSFR